MRGALLLAAFATAGVHAQTTDVDADAIVRIEVTDEALHEARALRREGAGAEELRRILIHQHGMMVLSGVAISGDGEIVTIALHPRARLRIVVTLRDGTETRAHLVGTDPLSNLALLRADVAPPRHLRLAGGEVALDDAVRIWGHAQAQPVRLDGRVAQTRTPVSTEDLYGVNEGRPLRIGAVFIVATSLGQANPGSACMDAEGGLRGIVIDRMPPLFMPRGEEETGAPRAYEMNFVLPADRIIRIVNDLRAHGRVVRAFLGIHIVPATTALRAHFPDLPGSAATILKIENDGPAARAGLRPNDVLLAVNGETYRDMCELGEVLTDLPPGQPVQLTVLRDGSPTTLPVTPVPDTPPDPDK